MNFQISTRISTQRVTPTAELARCFPSTPRGARLARHWAGCQLGDWGYPQDGDVNDTAQHLVAELAANAATHGRVPGRDFEVRLLLLPEGMLRIEVSDARGDRPLRFEEAPDGESGRGLVLVALLSNRWGVTERKIGKTVWTEVSCGPVTTKS
ncbi:ATP-binding protein [Streptomyces sp. YIM S03343]